MSILHLFTEYQTSDPETQRRNRLARSTWLGQPWREVPVTDAQLPRMWREEGRSFPFIRDVFDLGTNGAPEEAVAIYTNADICVSKSCAMKVAACLQWAEACYAYRRDFARLESPITEDQITRGAAYAGSDLCGFRVRWWRAHRSKMPDMILGLEAWDPCYRTLVDVTNPAKRVCVKDVIYHERHNSYWERPENRKRLKGQKLCLALAAGFLSKHGVDPKRHGIWP